MIEDQIIEFKRKFWHEKLKTIDVTYKEYFCDLKKKAKSKIIGK